MQHPSIESRRTALVALVLMLAFATGCADVVPDKSSFATGTVDDANAGTDAASDTAETVGDAEQDGSEPDVAADAGDTKADVVDADDTADTGDTGDTAETKDASTCDVAKCGALPNACVAWTCKDDACELIDRPDGATCDDGFDCTIGDTCAAGICLGENKTCACVEDSDCQDDGDLCNGVPYCDLSGAAPTCKVNPSTVISCPSVDDTDCEVNTCVPKTGKCEMALVKVPPGKFYVPCDDGNPCTQTDQCKDGKCLSGTNVCGCTTDADCASKDDGNPCTGTLYCDLLGAVPSCKPNPITVVSCPDDGNPCTLNACDAATGKCVAKPKAENAKCDDGNPCTDDTCQGGVCTPGVSNCGCKNDKDCSKLNPKNQCAGTYYCDTSSKNKVDWACKANPATVVQCADDDDTACRTNVCDPSTGQCGFEYANKFAKCDDGSPCTAGDTCDGKGGCVSGTSTCVCEKDADCADKDDGDLCNGTPYCDLSGAVPTCKTNPATVVSCPGVAGEACKENVCDPKTAKCAVQDKPDSSLCTDGTACIEAGSCVKGACVLSDISCGCVTDNDCKKPATDYCAGTPYCDKSDGDKSKWSCKAKPDSKVVCPAAAQGSCLEPTCVPATGTCTEKANDALCDDSDPCTFDICQVDGKCTHPDAPTGYACGDGKQCAAAKCVTVPPGMVLIPGGNGYAGCAADDKICASDEGKATPVQLSAFFIDRLEVSVAEFAKNCPNCSEKPGVDTGCNAAMTDKGQHPANCVTWTAANAYCQAQGKVLPTEAQWERAARGGCEVWGDACATATPIYPWNKSIATCDFAVMKDGEKLGCGSGGTAAVGTYSQDDSPYGVRDMGGNVREWTRDGYVADVWLGAAQTDPSPVPGAGGERVIKGGAFASAAPGVRSSRREGAATSLSAPTLGFRCAQPVAP